MDLKALKSNIYVPIVFVAIMMVLIAWFAEGISSLNPYLQFIIVTLPLSIVVLYYFGKNFDGWRVIIGLILINWSIDLVAPPYMIGLDGTITTAPLLAATSVDYLIGNTIASMGIDGFPRFFLTYVVCFAIIFLTANWLVKKRN